MHCDLRAENLRWSTELQCVMIVDFGESALLEIPDISQSEVSCILRSEADLRGSTCGYKVKLFYWSTKDTKDKVST